MSDKLHDLDSFLSLLQGVRPEHNGSFMARCPGHADKEPSLSIKEADGKILINCFAGCELGAIIEPLDLEARDLFLNGSNPKPAPKEIVATYDYLDADGKLRYQVVRYAPKDFRQCRPDGKGGRTWNLEGVKPLLYRLPDIIKAVGLGETIYIVEGEKDADTAWSYGLIATTNSGGAGKWHTEFSDYLNGANQVIVICDDDRAKPGNPGLRHGVTIANSLLGKVSKIQLIESLPAHDLTDYFQSGGDIYKLDALVSTCPEFEPKPAELTASHDQSETRLVCLASIAPEPVEFFWHPYIPKGKLTLLEGDPGCGKSHASLALVSAVTNGRGIPNMPEFEPGSAIIASAEDGLADTIRPRLDSMGACVSRVFVIDGLFTLDDAGCQLIESYIQQIQPKLAIIDPLMAYLSGALDVNKANQVRQVTAHLARLADTYRIAILAIRHLTKGGTLKPIYRGLGSIDFTAAARSVLLAGCDPENQQARALMHLKCNLAPLGEAIGYELREGHFYWTGHSNLTPGQVLAAGDGGSALAEAQSFLSEYLTAGAVPAKELYEEARKRAISGRTLERAKKTLGVTDERKGEKGKRGGGKSFWKLPGESEAQ